MSDAPDSLALAWLRERQVPHRVHVHAPIGGYESAKALLPFDPSSGRLVPDVWQRWLDWDPVRMVDRYSAAVRDWRAVWIDAGTRDEWYLDLGAEAFHGEVRRAGLPEPRASPRSAC